MSAPLSEQANTEYFRHVLGHYPTGIVVVTAVGESGQPVGMAVGSFTSVSLEPPLVAFLPDKSSSSFPLLREAASFCVNVLSEDQEDLCRQFARKGIDRFHGVEWSPAPSGAPVLAGSVAWIDCIPQTLHEAGDHFIVIGRVQALVATSDRRPLLFFRSSYDQLATPEDVDLKQ
ncbi:flavin reductase family protein [Rhodococcus wratislaviensis]|uniref:Putative oxidoreductase n=1 Tax=Rhodococcus wratislaviensis NBRC 100605 TaxID=1219028 RepID=X0Q0D9_RHOWR|nr:flavin reductase family protein [Rhodococcus wratislaviensis]GAF43596.1 putative oxidoreductase [Rhodococcus wratislaviensis NBRC 100605]